MEASLTPHEPQATPALTPQVVEVIAWWRPKNPTAGDAAALPFVLPTVRRWVTLTGPDTVATAALLMRTATGLALWGDASSGRSTLRCCYTSRTLSIGR